ncbi:MAG TPA: phospholipase D-like domain-containing protein [Steroidobacteraceae bacterium]|nr:phospholipase D-like domain-containing protein [Steroidobacteraceae bacterium]
MPPEPALPDASVAPGAAARRPPRRAPRRRRRLIVRLLLGAALCAWLGCAWWQTHKALPPGTHVAGPWSELPASDVDFVADITTADAYGRPILSHAIFDEMLRLARAAQHFIVIDTQLFAAEEAARGGAMPLQPLSAQLRDALIACRQRSPGLHILFITDPLNEGYGTAPARDLQALRSAGIDVVSVDLDRLRDPNFLYSSLRRLLLSWWRAAPGEGGLPNPLGGGPAQLPAAAWARLLDLKSDHRNVMLADDAHGDLVGLISSDSPQRAVSADSTVGVTLRGVVLEPLLASELAVARFSGWRGELPNRGAPLGTESLERDGASPSLAEPRSGQALPPLGVGVIAGRILTEGAIGDALLTRIGSTWRGDTIDVGALYLADRPLIDALLAASRRGVSVRLILDPNKEAFGRTVSGVPNRPAASELVTASDGAIRVRWYRTHGERFAATLVTIADHDRLWLLTGSANLTRRSLEDYDLDSEVELQMPRSSALAQQVSQYFETLWSNRAPLGIEYTTEVGVYADASPVSYWRYRLLEALGLSLF